MKQNKVFRVMVALLLVLATRMVYADGTVNVGSPESSWIPGITVADGVITITSEGSYVLQGTTTSNRVMVDSGVKATVTLENVSISSDVASPFALGDMSNVTLRLVGRNELTATMEDSPNPRAYAAAVQVEGGRSLTIEGTGILIAMGGAWAAGIGSGNIDDTTYTASTTGDITIKSGIIIAGNKMVGAGIGGGFGATAGNIIISGGSVFAWSNPLTDILPAGAGIGAGGYGSGGYIRISGGTVMTNRLGITESDQSTPVSITGGVVFADTVSPSEVVGNAIVQTNVNNITEAFIRAMGENIFKASNDTIRGEIAGDIVIVYDTVRYSDTIVKTEIIYDTLVQIVHDTITHAVVIHDTLWITLVDTIVETQIVYDTIEVPAPYETVIIIDNSATGVGGIVESTPLVLTSADGADMYYLLGLATDQSFTIYNSCGALVVRAETQPVRITGKGLFIVAQGGKYWKFVK